MCGGHNSVESHGYTHHTHILYVYLSAPPKLKAPIHHPARPLIDSLNSATQFLSEVAEARVTEFLSATARSDAGKIKQVSDLSINANRRLSRRSGR